MPTYAITKTSDCTPLITACDKALADKDTQIVNRDQQIGQAEAMLKIQASQIVDLDRKVNAWYRSPWLYLGLGLVGGFYLGTHH